MTMGASTDCVRGTASSMPMRGRAGWVNAKAGAIAPTVPAIRTSRRVIMSPSPAAIYSDLAGGDYSHRAGNARAAEPAVAVWVLAEILLVIILGVVELGRRTDLGCDGPVALRFQRLLEGRFRFLRRLELLVAVAVERRAVLGAGVVALAHALRGIMAFPEHLEQLFVAHDLGIEDHQHDLGMVGEAAADLLVSRVLRLAAGVADGGGINALRFPEQPLCAPEAAHAEHRLLQAGGKRRLERMAVHEVLRGHLHFGGTAGDGFLRRQQIGHLLHECEHSALQMNCDFPSK